MIHIGSMWITSTRQPLHMEDTMLFTTAFWRGIALALLRTALAGIVPFIPALAANPQSAWPLALSTVVLLLVVTVATSLRGIPDPGAVPWWQVLASRGLRQFGQFVAAGLVGAVVLADVHWSQLLLGAAASAISTVVIAALTLLPEAPAATLPAAQVDGRVIASGAVRGYLWEDGELAALPKDV